MLLWSRFLLSLAREPLVHFAVLGAILFLIWRSLSPAPADRIVLDSRTVAAIYEVEAKQLGREPTGAEQSAAVQRYLEYEALYHEALRLGLDTGDLIVKRRLVQKMRFLTESLSAPPAPSEAELRSYYQAHVDDFRKPGRLSFQHVFLARRQEPQTARARRIAGALEANPEDAAQGDPFLHGNSFARKTTAEVQAVFGSGFARALDRLPLEKWNGPIRSSYGEHWVRLTERTPAEDPPFESVREEVDRRWRQEKQAELTRQAIARIIAAYAYQVESPGKGAP